MRAVVCAAGQKSFLLAFSNYLVRLCLYIFFWESPMFSSSTMALIDHRLVQKHP